MKVDQKAARAMNRRSILNLLREQGSISRAEIAAAIGLSAATVTITMADLLDEGLVVEGKPSPGAMGRRPIPVDLNYDGLLAVGHKLMVGRVESVLTNLATIPILTRSASLPDQSPETIVAVCASLTEELMEARGAPGARLIGIGLALPGRIQDDVCIQSHRFGWTNVPIAKLLADRVHVPVWAEDDTNAFALGQQLFRLGRNHKTVGALSIGTGISCGVVIGGAVHHGASGSAGNLGHCTFDPAGPKCECGRRGCLQAFFSEPAIVSRWRKETGAPETATRDDMARAAQLGDKPALRILEEAGRGIGRFLAIFSNIIDPDVIVAGGEAVAFGEHLFEPMRKALENGTLAAAPPLQPDWTDSSWAQGAAALATRHIFDFEASQGMVRTS